MILVQSTDNYKRALSIPIWIGMKIARTKKIRNETVLVLKVIIGSGFFLIGHQHGSIQADTDNWPIHNANFNFYTVFLCKTRVNGRNGNLIITCIFYHNFINHMTMILIKHPLKINLLHKNLVHVLNL